MNKKIFIKYTAPVIALILIVVTAFYYLYEAPKTKVAQVEKKTKAQRATPLNYQGGMVVSEVSSIDDIMAELEGEPPAGGGTFDLKTMAAQITASALDAFSDKNESALPLVSHWNVGIPEFDEAMNPLYMINRLAQGEHILVSWKLDPYYDNTINDSYYEESIKKAAEIGLPLVFILPAPESALTKDSYYFEMNLKENANVYNTAGKVFDMLSPFGPDELWSEVGEQWSSSDIMQQIQEWYPNPPLVLFVNEDEAKKISWDKLYNYSHRYNTQYRDKGDESRQGIVNAQWKNKYTQLHEGFKKGFVTKAWQNATKFISYDTLSEKIGIDTNWRDGTTATAAYMNVWPLVTDGMTIDFDLRDERTDNTLNSPHFIANNLPFMLKEAKTQNPNFAYQLSINDNGKLEDAARYRGLTQFALWFLKPSTIRQASQFTTRDELTPLFKEVVDSVELIHYNDQLADFWKNGTLVSNGKSDLNKNIPGRYTDKERWFLLDTDANPKRPWEKDEQIAVWAFAVVKGEAPNREWLLYVQSPDGDMKDVTVSVPGYKDVLVDAGVMGSFYVLKDSSTTVLLETRNIKKSINFNIPLGKEISPNSTCIDQSLWNGSINTTTDKRGTTLKVINNKYTYAYQNSFPMLNAGKTYLVEISFQNYTGTGQFSLSHKGSDTSPVLDFEPKNGSQKFLFSPNTNVSSYGIKRKMGVGSWSANLTKFSIKEISEDSVFLFKSKRLKEREKLIKNSAVCFSSRSLHPKNTKDPHNTLLDAKSFYATRIDWVYSTDINSINNIKKHGYIFGGGLNSKLYDDLNKATYQNGRLKDKWNNFVTAPWMVKWNAWWGCVNSPEYQDTFLKYAKKMIDGGADYLQMDDPGMNARATAWGACYCEHCVAEATKAGVSLEHDMQTFQESSVIKFYSTFSKKIDAYAGRHVALSLNNFNGSSDYLNNLFDFGMAELSKDHANVADIYEKIIKFNKPQIYTYTDADINNTRRIIATAYASGGHIIVPYDVYNPNGERIFGKPKDYADLYGFVRAMANKLDGYVMLDVSGKKLKTFQRDNTRLQIENSETAHAFIRKNISDTIIHIVDWSNQSENIILKLKSSDFSNSLPIQAKLYVPAKYNESIHTESIRTDNFSNLKEELPITIISEGKYTKLIIPAVNPWGMIVVPH